MRDSLVWVTAGLALSVGGVIMFILEVAPPMKALTLEHFLEQAVGDSRACPLMWLGFTAVGLGFFWIAASGPKRSG